MTAHYLKGSVPFDCGHSCKSIIYKALPKPQNKCNFNIYKELSSDTNDDNNILEQSHLKVVISPYYVNLQQYLQ